MDALIGFPIQSTSFNSKSDDAKSSRDKQTQFAEALLASLINLLPLANTSTVQTSPNQMSPNADATTQNSAPVSNGEIGKQRNADLYSLQATLNAPGDSSDLSRVPLSNDNSASKDTVSADSQSESKFVAPPQNDDYDIAAPQAMVASKDLQTQKKIDPDFEKSNPDFAARTSNASDAKPENLADAPKSLNAVRLLNIQSDASEAKSDMIFGLSERVRDKLPTSETPPTETESAEKQTVLEIATEDKANFNGAKFADLTSPRVLRTSPADDKESRFVETAKSFVEAAKPFVETAKPSVFIASTSAAQSIGQNSETKKSAAVNSDAPSPDPTETKTNLPSDAVKRLNPLQLFLKQPEIEFANKQNLFKLIEPLSGESAQQNSFASNLKTLIATFSAARDEATKQQDDPVKSTPIAQASVGAEVTPQNFNLHESLTDVASQTVAPILDSLHEMRDGEARAGVTIEELEVDINRYSSSVHDQPARENWQTQKMIEPNLAVRSSGASEAAKKQDDSMEFSAATQTSVSAEIIPPTLNAQESRVDIVGQTIAPILDSLHEIGDRQTRALRLVLQPKELGAVEIRLTRSSSGDVSVHLAVERGETRATLQSGLSHLRETLARAGLSVEKLEVSLNHHPTTTHDQAPREERQEMSEERAPTTHANLPLESEDAAEQTSVVHDKLVSLRV